MILLDSKSDVCISKNGKDNNHTRHILRRVYFKVMVKTEKFRRFAFVRELCSWQTLPLRILVIMI